MSLDAARKELKEQHTRLLDEANRVLKALRELGGEIESSSKRRGGYKMSAEARERIKQAMIKRWAKAKRNPQGKRTLEAIKK